MGTPLHSGPYLVDGNSYSAMELADRCREVTGNGKLPRWYREVFSFTGRFLDQGAGAIVQRSSGTTGDPKNFELDREAMVASARKTISFFGLEPGDRVLLCLPVDYIAGKMMVVRALVGGLDLVLREPTGRPLENLPGKLAFAAMVPLQVHRSLEAGDDLSLIALLLVGGGEVHPTIRQAMAGMDPPALYESFGMTETYTHVALRRINGPSPDDWFRPLEGVKIHRDDMGCLVIDVPWITPGSVVTNDLVELEPGGLGFKWLGRADNVINTGGIKVIPEVLEQQVGKLLGHECLILPKPDPKLGQKLVLLVEYGGPLPPADRWLDQLREHFPAHEVPREIRTTRALPRNSSFKPDRKSAGSYLADR